MSDFHLDCTDYTFETQGELAVDLAVDLTVDLAFDPAFDLAFEVSPYSPADTQHCRVETAALPV